MNTFSDVPEAPEPQPELEPLAPGAEPTIGPPVEEMAPRDPAWSGLDVFRLFIMALIILFLCAFAMFAVVPGSSFKARALRLGTTPELLILAQMLAYLLLLGYMYILVTKERRSPRFWKALHWNWPASVSWYLIGGGVLQLALLLIGIAVSRFFPFPRNTPFDALLRRPSTVALIAVFAVTLGPLIEELFFRGFLYPVLARRFGVSIGVSTSALGFGLMHVVQYGYSWASVALIFLVGLVLGTVRAWKDSVAAGFLVHAAYNGTIMIFMLIASDGFRHLEKLSQ